jgi:hypothetical protein
VDTTKTFKRGREVVVWRVDVVFLTENDWKYEKSGAHQGRGGRTHTFGLQNPSARLAGCAAYELPGVVIKGGKPVLG